MVLAVPVAFADVLAALVGGDVIAAALIVLVGGDVIAAALDVIDGGAVIVSVATPVVLPPFVVIVVLFFRRSITKEGRVLVHVIVLGLVFVFPVVGVHVCGERNTNREEQTTMLDQPHPKVGFHRFALFCLTG